MMDDPDAVRKPCGGLRVQRRARPTTQLRAQGQVPGRIRSHVRITEEG